MRQARSFPAERESVTAARRFAAETLVGVPAEMREAAELMVSELATNCIRHGQASFELAIEFSPSEVRVEVQDLAPGQPAMRSPSPEQPHGRGLRIVDMLSGRWGVRYEASGGKTVWFTLSRTPASRAAATRSRAVPSSGRSREVRRSPCPGSWRGAFPGTT